MQATGTPSDGTVLPASIASSGHFKIPQLTVNEDGADVDFRVEGDTDANLLFVNAGTDRIGIGTDSPTSPLELSHATNPVIKVTSTSSSVGAGFFAQGGSSNDSQFGLNSGTTAKYTFLRDGSQSDDLRIYDSANALDIIRYRHGSYLHFGVNGSERMRIDSSGRVGIGTTPEEIFHIKGPTETIGSRDGVLLQHSTASNAADNGLPLVWSGYISTSNTNYGLASICGRKENSIDNNGAAYLQFGTGNDAGAISEKMRIDSNGNVGIGTSSPADITNYTSLSINHATSGGLIGLEKNGTRKGTLYLDASTADFIIQSESGENLQFCTNGSNERMRLFNNGKLALGTGAIAEPKGTAGGSFDLSNGNITMCIGGDNGQNGSRTNSTDKLFRITGPHYTNAEEPFGVVIGFCGSSDSRLIYGGGSTLVNAVTQHRFFTATNTTTTNGSERMRIDSSGNVGIGTTSPAGKLNIVDTSNDGSISQLLKLGNNSSGAGTGAGLQLGAGSGNAGNSTLLAGFYDGTGTSFTISTCNTFGGAQSEKFRVTNSGNVGIGATSPDKPLHIFRASNDAEIRLQTNSGTERNSYISLRESSGDLDFYTVTASNMKFHTSNTERMRITSSGNVNITNLCVAGAGLTQVDNAQSLISQSSVGSSSTTYFIGNASIQVSSDRRIKENIVDTSLNAITELNKVRVVDFTWNDPSDKAINNRNSRGKWTGCIAQEIVDVFPFAVNAPRPEGGEIDHDSEALWGMEYNQLVPVLIKGFQEIQAKIETLETKVAALEAA
jgi:hypothetical protein